MRALKRYCEAALGADDGAVVVYKRRQYGRFHVQAQPRAKTLTLQWNPVRSTLFGRRCVDIDISTW